MYPPFPTSLASQDFDIVVGLFSGHYPSANTALHAVDNVLGYGFGKIAPDGIGAEPDESHLIGAIPAGHPLLAFVKAGKIDWWALLLQLIQLLPNILPLLKPAS